MSFQEKNIAVTLASFSLILVLLILWIGRMVSNDTFTSTNVFIMWGVVIVMAIVVTIVATILTHIVSAIIEAVRSGGKEPEIDDTADERDRLIDLRGTKVTYTFSSIGVLLAMLTYVLGQEALVMFTLLIIVGVLAQVVGDVYRLTLYRRGF